MNISLQLTAMFVTFLMHKAAFQRHGNDCGSTSLPIPTGVLASRQFSFDDSEEINYCLYTIDCGNVTSVSLSIDRLSINTRDRSCRDERLTITCTLNGTVMLHPITERELCGYYDGIRARFPACSSLVFNFSSNYTGSDIQFRIRYRVGVYELDCGDTLFTNSSGVIKLPVNPTGYPATVNCTYTISANRLSHIWLYTLVRGSSMSLMESFQDCDGEHLTIGCMSEGGTELNPNTTKVFCNGDVVFGTHVSETSWVFSDCRTLKLSIRSDTYDHRAVLSGISFSVLGPSELCGNTSFSSPTGIVSSPRIPFPYPTSIRCLYVIESDRVNSVVLSVNRLELGTPYVSHGSCNSNWLMITCLVNETSMAHPMADRKLCGSLSPTVLRFPACSSVLLNFTSDYSSYGTGFSVRYRMGDYDPECGKTSFSGPDGFIASPRFPLRYPHNLNCLYSINGDHRKFISLSFLSFRLDGYSRPTLTDACYSDWLTVSCLSDESVLADVSSLRKYCGIKTTPLRFSFRSCAVVVLNFVSNWVANEGGFNVRYTARDADSLCGSPLYRRPSGVISLPWNYADHDGDIDCNYTVRAMQPSSISLTILSISLRNSSERNCQRDWLLITCLDDQTAITLNVSHKSCDSFNSSIQLTFSDCSAAQVYFHRDTEATGKTFLIQYTVTSYGGDVVNPRMNLSSPSGQAVGISLTVILLVTGSIGVGAFLQLIRRHRKKNRSQMLLHVTDEDGARTELEADSTEAGSLLGANCNEGQDTSPYLPSDNLPLGPMSLSRSESDEPSSYCSNMAQNDIEIQPSL